MDGFGVYRRCLRANQAYGKICTISVGKHLFLHARENACGFYEKMGYLPVKKSYVLFNTIQYIKMKKNCGTIIE